MQIYDDTPPRIESCLPPEPVNAELYARVRLRDAQFSDNSIHRVRNVNASLTTHTDIGMQVVSSQPERYVWPYGVTPVVITAVDRAGNNRSCQYDVTILG